MAPKKEKGQKLTLTEFMTEGTGGGNWADEVEETYGTQPLPPADRNRGFASSFGGDRGGSDRFGAGGGGSDRYAGYARQEREELPLPDKPPYTAHLGNLSYDANQEAVTDFFTSAGCSVVSVRIVEDRAEMRPKGFGYAEFTTVDDLKKALELNEESFFSRNIRIRVADPPKDRYGNDSNRDFSDWSRKGPLADLPRSNTRGPREFNDARGGEREFREPREPREPPRDLSGASWERRGPLSPVAAPPVMERGGSRTGSRMGERTNSFANRGASPAAWGPGEGRQDSRPPNREPRERAPTAAEQESSWRAKMRPDAPAGKSPVPSRAGSEAPSSPALAPAAPAGRPKLQLAKRTVTDAPGVMSPSLGNDSKASPFGAARPIDTATREREIEEKHQRELQEKKEAEDKAKEDKRLAKEAAAKEAAAKEAIAKEAAEIAPAENAEANGTAEVKTDASNTAEATTTGETTSTGDQAVQNGTNGAEQTLPIRTREPREPREPASTRATESGNWRSSGTRGAPSGPRGGRGGSSRGGGRNFEERQPSRRGNNEQRRPSEQQRRGSAQETSTPTTPVVDADGWSTVTTGKGRRGARQPVS
ncbi:Eukaryotic translation initiation factor 4B [Gnomoniopsis smithogilvyi]|uniref:Eukaryotic translation initiation factor 4B n=1 Tax=Gnomoniopsis smithogilvyi TaxID=1191159 RepID=A0A9W9CWV9_9PEZI|nr:Eukaryotic translation initiation factor 4B [Gnomoniopsis smithogilvyi]